MHIALYTYPLLFYGAVAAAFDPIHRNYRRAASASEGALKHYACRASTANQWDQAANPSDATAETEYDTTSASAASVCTILVTCDDRRACYASDICGK